MNRPQTTEYPESYSIYINVVDGDIMNILTKQPVSLTSFFNKVKGKADYTYAPGKWTIRQLLGHLVDTERVMSYRLMCFARGEEKDLPGFDENRYVAKANFSQVSMVQLCNEFSALRHANLLLIKSLDDEELDRKGSSNGKAISVRALVFMLAGHVIHHLEVVKERYLKY